MWSATTSSRPATSLTARLLAILAAASLLVTPATAFAQEGEEGSEADQTPPSTDAGSGEAGAKTVEKPSTEKAADSDESEEKADSVEKKKKDDKKKDDEPELAEPGTLYWVGVASLATGGAALLTSGVLGVLSIDQDDEANFRTQRDEFDKASDARELSDTYSTAALGMAITGGVLVVAGATMMIVEYSMREPADSMVLVTPLPDGGAAASFTLRF